MPQSFARKHTRISMLRLALVLGLAVALLLPLAGAASAQGLTPGGSSCVEGLVIDWQENPIESGWFVVGTPYIDGELDPSQAVEVYPSEEDGREGQFEIDDDPHLISEDWQFEIFLLIPPDENAPEVKAAFDVLAEDEDAPKAVSVAPLPQAAPMAPTANGDDGVTDDDGFLIGDWFAVTDPVFDVTLDTSGKCTRIRFKLIEIVPVFVTKIDADHNLLDDWTITATPGKDNKFAYELEGTTGEEEEWPGGVWFFVSPGEWIFTEEAPDDVGDDYYPVIPTDGQQALDVEPAKDRVRTNEQMQNEIYPPYYTLRFKNEVGLGGCIQVLKTDLAPEEAEFNSNFPLAGWEISVLRADGSEADFGYTDPTGVVKFDDLAPGPYTVQEETRVGWELVTEEVPDEIYVDYEQALSSSVNVTATVDSCVLIKFVNEQADATYAIKGRKVDANGKYGIPGWTISATPLDKGGLELDDVVTDGSGYYEFELPGDDYRIPGARYEICEDDDVDGWESVSATCFTITIPEALGSTATVPDFVNKQVGHETTSSSSSGWSAPMKGGMGKPMPMKRPMRPMNR